MRTFHDGPWGGQEHIDDLVETYSINGMLFFPSKTCRMWNLGQQEIIANIERKYGIPGVDNLHHIVDTKFAGHRGLFSDQQFA